MVQGQVFLKGGGGSGPFIFSRFIIFTFINKLLYSLQNCYFMKKDHYKLSEIS